jgi:hypothetical protein
MTLRKCGSFLGVSGIKLVIHFRLYHFSAQNYQNSIEFLCPVLSLDGGKIVIKQVGAIIFIRGLNGTNLK